MNKRELQTFFLIVAVGSAVWLFNIWQKQHTVVVPSSTEVPQQKSVEERLEQQDKAIIPNNQNSLNQTNNDSSSSISSVEPQDIIMVSTDVMNVKIDKCGGDIVGLELLKYPEVLNSHTGYNLFVQNYKGKTHIAQSGLLSKLGPDDPTAKRAYFQTDSQFFELTGDRLKVELRYSSGNIYFIKSFEFKRGDYNISVNYKIDNRSREVYTGNFYARLRRNLLQNSKGGFLNSDRSYTGGAVSYQDKSYYKLPLLNMKKTTFDENVVGGWAAMVEHHFTSAWIPDNKTVFRYQSEFFVDDTYAIRITSSPIKVPAGKIETIGATLYAGPAVVDKLKQAAPHLELTVDYGMLWWLCQPLFWLLHKIYVVVGNWGLAIILITVFIKLLFYKLSSSSYRSMGKMRSLQPKIEALKLRYPDDKQKFGQELLQLYRQEKVNPLGGCLPILVQIPVFIALYYVLLASVELRQAPFVSWITDLSSKDPYYILPLLMGGTMFWQQKLQPASPDPMQAKIFLLMPIMFTILFLNFPSGLVLYWTVNNLLSIAQQIFINKFRL